MSESLVLDIDVKPLKQQLRDATKDLQLFRQKFGETSTEAVNAAKKVAAIKDALQGANEAAQLFDPGSRFQALTSAASTAAGGISAVQGAMALFGAESDNVAKTLQKVQGAMALSQGLSQLKDIGKVGEQLKLTFGGLTAGMSNFKKALISTGVGALVAGLGLLIANFDKVKETINNLFPGLAQFGNYISNLTQKFTDFIGVTNKADRELETFRKNNKLRNEQLERDIALLTAQGGKEAEIAEIRKQIARNELEELTKSADKKGKLYGEDAKKYKELNNELSIIDAQEDKRKKDKEKKDEEVNKAAAEKKAAEAKAAKERQIKERKEIEDFELALQQRLLQIDEENIAKEKERREKAAEEAKAYNDFDTQLQLDLRKLDEENASKKIAALDLEISKNAQNFDAQRELLNQKDESLKQSFEKGIITEQAYNEAVFANSKARQDIDKKEKDAKIENAMAISALLSGLSNVMGKESAAGKAFAVASATIDTYLAAQKAYQSMAGIPIVGPALGAVAAGVAVAGGIKNVKSILAVKTPGGGGGGNVPQMPTFGSAPMVSSAVPTLGNSPVTSIATLSNQNQKPIRAYVVESEVTATQRRVSDIERRAGF